MPFRLPIFPLAVVLFPGNPLPLHIFEPRYRRMLADCLTADRRFGIIPAEDNAGPPGPGAVGCVAEIRVNQELPDGRSNLIVVGGSRFVLVQLMEPSLPYLVATVEPFEDDSGSSPTEEEVSGLRSLAVRYFAGLRELSDAPPEDVTLPDDPAELSFRVAGGLDCDLQIKRRLLAESSTARRIEALTQLLPILSHGVERSINVHRRAHGNGIGGGLPDVLTS